MKKTKNELKKDIKDLMEKMKESNYDHKFDDHNYLELTIFIRVLNSKKSFIDNNLIRLKGSEYLIKFEYEKDNLIIKKIREGGLYL